VLLQIFIFLAIVLVIVNWNKTYYLLLFISWSLVVD